MKFKILDTYREDTDCHSLLLSKYRNDEGFDGVLFIAWHKADDTTFIQTDFVKMEEQFLVAFIRDYSSMSAQNYVDSFSL